MEPESSLPHSQVPATCPYHEPVQSSPYPHILLPEDPAYYYPPIYSMLGSPQWTLSLSFPHQNHVDASLLSHTRYIPHPSHPRFYHPNISGRGVQI